MGLVKISKIQIDTQIYTQNLILYFEFSKFPIDFLTTQTQTQRSREVLFQFQLSFSISIFLYMCTCFI